MADRKKMERPTPVFLNPANDTKNERISVYISPDAIELLKQIGLVWGDKHAKVAALIIDDYLQEQIKLKNIKKPEPR